MEIGETAQRDAAAPSLGVHAAVDAGSNSVHLLVAGVADHRLEPLLDESVFLGLGAAVAASGAIGPERRAALVSALADYVRRARDLGAVHVVLLGTEPFRGASDANAVKAEVQDVCGVPLHVLDHEDEARLTAIGVTLGRRATTPVLMVDIGGGSTEFIVLRRGEQPRAWGVRIGSSRLTEAAVHHDPPLRSEIDAMRRQAREAFASMDRVDVGDITAVGGTAGNLVKIVPEAMVDGLLTADRLENALGRLMSEPAATFGERHVLNPRRAPLLPAGAVIVEAILEWAGVPRVRALDVGVREGAVMAVSRAGDAWRERLAELVQGWE